MTSTFSFMNNNLELSYFPPSRKKRENSVRTFSLDYLGPKCACPYGWRTHVHTGAWVREGNVSFQAYLTVVFPLGLLWTYLIPESPHFPWVLCGVNKPWSEDVTALWGAAGQWSGLFSLEWRHLGPKGQSKEQRPLFSKIEGSWILIPFNWADCSWDKYDHRVWIHNKFSLMFNIRFEILCGTQILF